jgi:hypothetical protein
MNNIITIVEFDQHQFGRYLSPSTLVLHINNLATIVIVGFNPREARPENIVIGIVLSRFYIRIVIRLMTSQDD